MTTFLKENIARTINHNGQILRFEPFEGNYGILKTDDEQLIAALRSLQAKKIGGVFEADEARLADVKKKVTAHQSRKGLQPSRELTRFRVEPKLGQLKNAAEAGKTPVPEAGDGQPLTVPQSIKLPKPKLPPVNPLKVPAPKAKPVAPVADNDAEDDEFFGETEDSKAEVHRPVATK